MPFAQPRPKGQPSERGNNRTGGYKTPSKRVEDPSVIDDGRTIRDSLDDIAEGLQTIKDFIDKHNPVPNPFIHPSNLFTHPPDDNDNKDLESLGIDGLGYGENREEPEKDPEDYEIDPAGWGHLEWGDTGRSLEEVTNGGLPHFEEPAPGVRQPEGIWLPPLNPPRIPQGPDITRPAIVAVSLQVEANKGNRYSSPSFDGSQESISRSCAYYRREHGSPWVAGGTFNKPGSWVNGNYRPPKFWFRDRGHWNQCIKEAKRYLSQQLIRFFKSPAWSFNNVIRAIYKIEEDGDWTGPSYAFGTATFHQKPIITNASSEFNFYFKITWDLNPPRLGKMHPFPKRRPRRNTMNCCPQLLRNQDRMIKDLKLIKEDLARVKTWTGADYDVIEVPENPFMDLDKKDEDANIVVLGTANPNGGKEEKTKEIGSIPDLINYFIQNIDIVLGDAFPIKIKTPQHILEGAQNSGEGLPPDFELTTPGEALKAIFEMTLNLQDDEGNAKRMIMKNLLETYKGREEAYKARNTLDQIVKWLGMEYEEVKNYLSAEFTLPETDNDPENFISWEDWKERYKEDDDELDAFLQPSEMAVKAKFFDVQKFKDLEDIFYMVRNIYSIVRAVHTVPVGKHRDGIKEKLTEYLIDFGAKYAYHTVTAPKQREELDIGQDEDDDSYDPKGLKDFKKFRKAVENGLVPPEQRSRGMEIRNRSTTENMPYGRHPEESAEIRDVTEE